VIDEIRNLGENAQLLIVDYGWVALDDDGFAAQLR